MSEESEDPGEISDGHHTFNELYDHRHRLFITLCEMIEAQRWPSQVWRSWLHADGTMYDGWFIMGINETPGDQITYHLPEWLWHETMFAKTLDRAPEWDGHTSVDVLERLRTVAV